MCAPWIIRVCVFVPCDLKRRDVCRFFCDVRKLSRNPPLWIFANFQWWIRFELFKKIIEVLTNTPILYPSINVSSESFFFVFFQHNLSSPQCLYESLKISFSPKLARFRMKYAKIGLPFTHLPSSISREYSVLYQKARRRSLTCNERKKSINQLAETSMRIIDGFSVEKLILLVVDKTRRTFHESHKL